MENTIITSVEIIKLNIPYKEPFVISLGIIPEATNIVVNIHTSSGLTGTGECAPFVFIVGETQETVFELAKKIGRLIKKKDPFAIEDRLSEIDRAVQGNFTMKSAFDMALYDLLAKKANLPLYKLLGGSNSREVYTDMTISIGEPERKGYYGSLFSPPTQKIRLTPWWNV